MIQLTTLILILLLDITKLSIFNTQLVAIYDQQKWLFGLLSLILVGIIALILSFITDWMMSKLGYKSEKIEHVE